MAKQLNITVEIVNINTNNEFVTKTKKATPYYLGTVRFKNPKGEYIERTAQFWKNAYEKDGYSQPEHSAVVSITEDNTPFITVTAGWGTSVKATLDDFDMTAVEVVEKAGANI